MLYLCLLFVWLGSSEIALGEGEGSSKQSETTSKRNAEKSEQEAAQQHPSTHIDFSEASIDGKMKVPFGLMLRARESDQLQRMVEIRSDFAEQLVESKDEVRALP